MAKIAIDFGTRYSKVAIQNGNNLVVKIFHTNKTQNGNLIEKDEVPQGRIEEYQDTAFDNSLKRYLINSNYSEDARERVRIYLELLRNFIEGNEGLNKRLNVNDEMIFTYTLGNDYKEIYRGIVQTVFGNNNEFVSEAVASGFYYLKRIEINVEPHAPSMLLVCDIGAGTTDISMIIVPNPRDIRGIYIVGRSIYSFNYGGNNLTKKIIKEELKRVSKELSFDEAENKKTQPNLLINFSESINSWKEEMKNELNNYITILNNQTNFRNTIYVQRLHTIYSVYSGGGSLIYYGKMDIHEFLPEQINKTLASIRGVKIIKTALPNEDIKNRINEAMLASVIGAIYYVDYYNNHNFSGEETHHENDFPTEINHQDLNNEQNSNVDTDNSNNFGQGRCRNCGALAAPGSDYCYNCNPGDED